MLITIAAVSAVLIGGVCIAIQAPINGALGRMTGEPLLAAAISFAVGLVPLTALALVRGGVPAAATLTALPWWAWIGGPLGAVYVVASIWAAPQVGVLTVAAAAVLGQLSGALALDAVGAFGMPAHPIELKRIAAVAMVAGGVILSRI
ncbi:MAG: DMT family transporter [Rubrimonas sp.]